MGEFPTVTDEPVLARIDRTLNLIDARLEQSERRWEQRDREWRRLTEENRRYSDALLERHARITADQIAAIEAYRAQSEMASAALQAEIADQRSQIKSQTEALLRVLDRLPPGERPQG
jgi:hypothetical protein